MTASGRVKEKNKSAGEQIQDCVTEDADVFLFFFLESSEKREIKTKLNHLGSEYTAMTHSTS